VRATDLETGDDQLIDPATDASLLVLLLPARRVQIHPVRRILKDASWFSLCVQSALDLVIIGAVHVAQPLTTMAALAGYGVRIIDPRSAFATEARFPGVELSHDGRTKR